MKGLLSNIFSVAACSGLLWLAGSRIASSEPATQPAAPTTVPTLLQVLAPSTGPTTAPQLTAQAVVPTTLPTTQPVVQAPATAPSTQPVVFAAPPPRYDLIRGQPGFWRVARQPDGVWWFVSPQNQPEFLNLVTSVQPILRGRDPNGPDFVSLDFDPKSPDALVNWSHATSKRVLDMGFKGVGAWSNAAFHQCDIPMTQDLNLCAWVRGSAYNSLLFSPEWSKAAEDAVKAQAAPLRDNHTLVGYYLDNEINWEDEVVPSLYFNGLRRDDPNRLEVISVIQSLWKDVSAFNGDWSQHLADWNALNGLQDLPRANAAVTARLGSAWLSHLSESYFRITTSLLKKYDPNHLVLGVRYRGSAPLEVVQASRPYTDAQSLNYYVSDARLDPDTFGVISDDGRQPVVISEYSFHSMDNRSGDRNLIGFDAQVIDQQARADAYRLFTSRAAKVPFLIGADWFQWSDEPASGREQDGEDVNFGIVDVDDRPYEPLAAAVHSTAMQLDALHNSSARDQRIDVWRESFVSGAHPHFVVPQLHASIKLDARLDDWPAECKVAGVRASEGIGAERNTMPVPDLYMGWTPDALYLAFTVYDHDVSAAPPTGWWWARDCVEFWISTRPSRPDQTHYDQYCHHFFFVPVDYPTRTGSAGVVGQWHSPGDTLQDNLIPHPSIRQVTRILKDRYVVEMMIPAKALNGFDPTHQPDMAFNFQARDFQHAADYFWSAPKQVLTQSRPNTWGALHLDLGAPTTAPALAGTINELKPQ